MRRTLLKFLPNQWLSIRCRRCGHRHEVPFDVGKFDFLTWFGAKLCLIMFCIFTFHAYCFDRYIDTSGKILSLPSISSLPLPVIIAGIAVIAGIWLIPHVYFSFDEFWEPCKRCGFPLRASKSISKHFPVRNIHGVVYNWNGEAFPNARVSITHRTNRRDFHDETMSNENGCFHFAGVADKDWIMVASVDGQANSKEITINSDNKKNLNIYLENPEPDDMPKK